MSESYILIPCYILYSNLLSFLHSLAPAVPPNHVPMCFAHSSVRSDTRLSLVGTNFIPNIFLLRDAAPCSRSHVLRTFLCTKRYSPFARGNKIYAGHFLLRDAAPCSRCSVTLHPVHGPMCFAHSSVRNDTRISLVGTNFIPDISDNQS